MHWCVKHVSINFGTFIDGATYEGLEGTEEAHQFSPSSKEDSAFDYMHGPMHSFIRRILHTRCGLSCKFMEVFFDLRANEAELSLLERLA